MADRITEKPLAGTTHAQSSRSPGGAGERWLVPSLYLAEFTAIGILLLAYRAQGKGSTVEFLVSRPGILCIGAAVILLGALGVVVQQCRVGLRSGSKQWIFALVMNAVVVLGLLGTGEIALRILAFETNTEVRIAGKLLYPRQWDVTAAKFRAILKYAESHPPFWIPDADLGWVIGPNRQGANGLYFSSAEGLRSTRPDESYRNVPSPCRIALIGDSFTFGEEVRYEDAWAHLLDRQLGPHCRILNFGVGGYGIDQMYLRYVRDVQSWKPNIVIMAFVNHDVVRSMSVYSFLLFPGGETPFAKPRFVVKNGQLHQLNRPLITPEAMFSQSAISDLPYIKHDANYKETEWDRPGWGFLNPSYVLRFFNSLYPLHEHERPEISDAVLQEVNTELFRAFRRDVSQSGAQSLVVYLPSVDELPHRQPWEPIGLKTLREGQIPHLDLRDCMQAGHVPDMFMPEGQGQHYAPAGNRVVAGCLLEPIRTLIVQPSPRQGTAR